MKSTQLLPIERIADYILILRGHKVMLDTDLARLYGVTTKRLNEQVKRNRDRFPEDFLIQLTEEEKVEVVANCDHLVHLKFSTALPYAFTEHGAIMAANILNSPIAVKAGIQVVRVFVRLRQILATHKDLSHKLEALERKYDTHDVQIQKIFAAIRKIMIPPEKSERRIGFRQHSA